MPLKPGEALTGYAHGVVSNGPSGDRHDRRKSLTQGLVQLAQFLRQRLTGLSTTTILAQPPAPVPKVTYARTPTRPCSRPPPHSHGSSHADDELSAAAGRRAGNHPGKGTRSQPGA